jgi:hypothetical protein
MLPTARLPENLPKPTNSIVLFVVLCLFIFGLMAFAKFMQQRERKRGCVTVHDLGCDRIADDGTMHRRLRTHQQIECDDVRDHQQRHVDDRDRVGGSQLPRQGRKAELGGVVIVDDEVGRAHARACVYAVRMGRSRPGLLPTATKRLR